MAKQEFNLQASVQHSNPLAASPPCLMKPGQSPEDTRGNGVAQVGPDVPPGPADRWPMVAWRRTVCSHLEPFPTGWDRLQGTCREHKVPNKAFTQAVQGNKKLHFKVKDYYLPWHWGELMEKLIPPHNGSLMKRNRVPEKTCHTFRKGTVLHLLWTGTVKKKSGASETLKTTQVDKT